MELHPPLAISARLLPAIQVGQAWISLDTGSRFWIDLPDGSEHLVDDIRPGAGGFGSVKAAFECLLSFLGACAESRAYATRTGRAGENAGLFSEEVGAWAERESDEIAMLQCELQEVSK